VRDCARTTISHGKTRSCESADFAAAAGDRTPAIPCWRQFRLARLKDTPSPSVSQDPGLYVLVELKSDRIE
jgi:hypothetical protein